MAFQPSTTYKHGGHVLHPKLTYALPPAMQTFLVTHGFGVAIDALADIDLSSIQWDAGTTLYNHVVPAPIDHPQE